MPDQGEPGTTRITLAGEYDVATAPSITLQVDEALRGRPARIVLDMSKVTFLDSTALGAMIASRNACIAASARLTVVDGSPAVKKILDLTGTGPLFEVVEPGDA